MSERELVLIDGATEFSCVRGLAGAVWRWRRLRHDLTTTPGYVAHRLWFRFPTTIGLLTWWEEEAAAYAFAHSPAHRDIWQWAAGGTPTRGGWLAVYRRVHGGPLWGNGVGHQVRTFGRFVHAPLGTPPDPPPDA